jgi:hypothetical protein
MRASRILALTAFSLALCSTAAWAEETAKPAAKPRGNEITLDVVKIKGRAPRPQVTVDINKLVPRAPLPELRTPLVDRIAAPVEKDPF